MKEKILYAIVAALAVAVIILFVLHLTGNKNSSEQVITEVSSEGDVTEYMSVAYVDIDSLMTTYTYSIDLNEELTKKFEDARLKMAEQANVFQKEVNEFQRKLENNIFLTRERKEQEEQRLIKKNEELQKLEAKYSEELAEERFKANENLRKTILQQIQDYNKEKQYHFIYGKTNDNILYAKDVYNITTEVIDFLNRKYADDPIIKPKK